MQRIVGSTSTLLEPWFGNPAEAIPIGKFRRVRALSPCTRFTVRRPHTNLLVAGQTKCASVGRRLPALPEIPYRPAHHRNPPQPRQHPRNDTAICRERLWHQPDSLKGTRQPDASAHKRPTTPTGTIWTQCGLTFAKAPNPMQGLPKSPKRQPNTPKPDPFADARRLRPMLSAAEFAELMHAWNGAKPKRGKLLGIDLAAFVLDTGPTFTVESVHLYARKGAAWHRLEHLPARIDGSWRYELRVGPREWAVDVLRSERGKPTERATVTRIGGDSLRERFLRLPGNTQPGR